MPSSARKNTVTTVVARDNFSDVLNRAAYGKERVVLTRRGKPLAALVPIEDVAALEAAEDAQDLAIARKRLAAWEKGGRKGVPLDQLKREYGIKR